MSPTIIRCPPNEYKDAALNTCAKCIFICRHSSTRDRCTANCPDFDLAEAKLNIRTQRKARVNIRPSFNNIDTQRFLVNSGEIDKDVKYQTEAPAIHVDEVPASFVTAIVINVVLGITIIGLVSFIILCKCKGRKVSLSNCFKSLKSKMAERRTKHDVECPESATDQKVISNADITRHESSHSLISKTRNKASTHECNLNTDIMTSRVPETQRNHTKNMKLSSLPTGGGNYSSIPMHITKHATMDPTSFVSTNLGNHESYIERHAAPVHQPQSRHLATKSSRVPNSLHVMDKRVGPRVGQPSGPRSHSRDLSSFELVSNDYFSSDLKPTGAPPSVGLTQLYDTAVERLRQNRLSLPALNVLHVTIFDDGVDIYVRPHQGFELTEAREKVAKIMGLRTTQLRLRLDPPPGHKKSLVK